MNKRVFESGASRNSDEGKLDHGGFNSAIVDLEYAKYMHKNRFLEDGTMRDGDNWKKGFPIEEIVKSINRHHMDFRLLTEGYIVLEDEQEHKMKQALMGLRFNVNAYLHEMMKHDVNVNRNYNK
jgi:hypothetical protein